jgi:hypothetical protein
VLALVCAAAGAGAAASAAGPQRATAAGTHARAASATCAAKPRLRARAACRRARVTAGYRRGARRGRAVLARPSLGAPGHGTAPTAGDPGSATPPPPGTGAAPPPGSAPPGVASTVGAEAYDFGTFVLRLSRTAVPAGDLTIYFRNHDISEHNLWLDAPPASGVAPLMISEAVGENGGATKTVAVTPGTWRLYCSLLGHDAMTRDLAVG